MSSGVKVIPSIPRKKYLLHNNHNNLVVKQLTILEIQVLYDAIKENIKVVNGLFTNDDNINFEKQYL